MREPDDNDLLLYHYDEAPNAEEIRRRLESSPELRSRYEALRRDLDLAERAMVPPARPESYGAELWARLQPRLEEAEAEAAAREAGGGKLLPWLRPSGRCEESVSAGRGPARRAGLAAAAMLLLAAGFYAGRVWKGPEAARSGAPAASAKSTTLSAPARERILVHAVAEHFERSERLFTELANAGGEGPIDIGAERRWARDLLEANRLYRQSARQGVSQGGVPGETARLGPLLDELEPFLLDLCHGPDEIPARELDELRQRFEERALLFKLRVAGSRLSGPQTL